ncbi:dipeptidase [Chloroflexota bacterium]
MQPCYYKTNFIGEGSGERTDGGLSNFGLEFVEEMNRLNLLIDVSHCKDGVTTDCLKFSKQPVIISHANPRGMLVHHRNKTDEQIKAMAEKGGVMGLTLYSPFCQLRKGVRPTIEDYLDLLDYVVKLVGIDYVGFATDTAIESKEEFEESLIGHPGIAVGYFERNIFTDEDGCDNPRHIPELAEGLASRGYSDEDIEKFLGLNFMRVFKDVWGT